MQILFIKINECLKKLQANPLHFQIKYKELRIAFTKQFPNGIYFSMEEDNIFVHTILHTKQNPEIAIKRSE
jgi:toxin ParE1/3/4